MAKRPTRLRFTEDDLSSDAVKKAAGKAEKAAAKAEKAVDKITPKKHRKLRQEADVSASRTAKLRFGKAKADDIPPKPSGIKRTVTHRILNVTLTNYGLGNVIASSRLTAEQWERYKVLLETLGNRSYLFGEDVSSAPGGGGEYTDYDIPGEALTDTAFANMVREAEKYLGYPYVWGGSSPSTSFDCSGFVSWVINNCGNGWSVGRQTANGLKNLCDIIPPSEAKPGDLIFFQGTYNTSGASHVGIYVGNNMMIHCGDPIHYSNISTSYWQQHFMCFGRLP